MTSGRTSRRAAFCSLFAAVLPVLAKDKKPQHFGVISGSVFRETGFSFAGVEVVVTLEPNPEDKKAKRQQWKGRSDARGEFAFRVPAMAGRYTVVVRAEAYRPQERTLELGIDERRELIINMEPAR